MNLKISDKLKLRLKSELNLDVNDIERVPRGRHQAAAGQFAWRGTLSNKTTVGSEDTMTDCVNAVSLGYYSDLGFSGTINITAETLKKEV